MEAVCISGQEVMRGSLASCEKSHPTAAWIGERDRGGVGSANVAEPLPAGTAHARDSVRL